MLTVKVSDLLEYNAKHAPYSSTGYTFNTELYKNKLGPNDLISVDKILDINDVQACYIILSNSTSNANNVWIMFSYQCAARAVEKFRIELANLVRHKEVDEAEYFNLYSSDGIISKQIGLAHKYIKNGPSEKLLDEIRDFRHIDAFGKKLPGLKQSADELSLALSFLFDRCFPDSTAQCSAEAIRLLGYSKDIFHSYSEYYEHHTSYRYKEWLKELHWQKELLSSLLDMYDMKNKGRVEIIPVDR